jgi:hypothetical protein
VTDRDSQCPRCGADIQALQEYCVDCGHRIHSPGVVPALATGWRRRVGWYPGDWVWPSLLALVVAVVSAAGAIWWTREASSAASTTVVGDTAPLPTVATTTAPATAPSPTVPTGTTTTTATPRRLPARRTLVAWPRGRNGWTLVLLSLPTSSGRETAVTRAREALRSGLPQVGVIESSRYASLHPGYYVVFSGIYPSISEAQDAVTRAAESGYENAYARQVTS